MPRFPLEQVSVLGHSSNQDRKRRDYRRKLVSFVKKGNWHCID